MDERPLPALVNRGKYPGIQVELPKPTNVNRMVEQQLEPGLQPDINLHELSPEDQALAAEVVEIFGPAIMKMLF